MASPKIPLFIILLFSLSLCAQERNIATNFYIKNYASNAVYVTQLNEFLKGTFPHVIEANNQELFSKFLGANRQPSFITMRFKGGSIGRNYLVYPGDTLNIYFLNNVPEVKFSDVKREKEFQYMNDLFSTVKESDGSGLKLLSKTESLEMRDKYFQSIYLKQLDFLNQRTDDYGLTEQFKKLFRLFIFSKMVINKYEAQTHQYKFASGLKDFYKNEFSRYVDSFDCAELLNTYEYKKAAMIVSNVIAQKNQASFEEINKNFTDSKSRNFLLSKYIYDGLNLVDTSVNKYIHDYFREVDDFLYENKIETLYNLKNGKAISATGKSVGLFNATAQLTDFNDFLKQNRGKVIYLDFWATWCAPCIKEMPHSEKLRQYFKGKDVAFMFISIDEDYDLWKENSVTKSLSNAEGNFIFENEKNALTEMLTINAIPRYVIIDKKGNFYQLNATRPSEEKIRQTINKLLK